MQNYLSDSTVILQNLNIYTNLLNEYGTYYGAFITEITTQAQEFISWKEEITQKNELIVNLTIENENKQIEDIILALHYVDHLSAYLHAFAINLLKHFIKSIITKNCYVYVVQEKVFNVEIIDNSKTLPEYKSVLHNLQLLFTFLNQHFNMNIGDRTFLSRLGDYLLDEFFELLIKNCISNIIPNSRAKLESFDPIADDINEFQNYLLDIGKFFFLNNFFFVLKKFCRIFFLCIFFCRIDF